MPRQSKTEYAVLGLLTLKPMSGYEMKAFITTSIGFFWHESYGQLYPALGRLLTKGLVSKTVEDQAGKPDRHIYSITASGREYLEEWLKADTDPERLRIELLLKLFFGPSTDTQTHVRHLESFLEEQDVRLRRLEKVELTAVAAWAGSPHHVYFLSTLRYGVHVTRARIAWCRETLDRLTNPQ